MSDEQLVSTSSDKVGFVPDKPADAVNEAVSWIVESSVSEGDLPVR